MISRLLLVFALAPNSIIWAQESTTSEDDPYARVWERWEQFEAEDHAVMASAIQDFVFEGAHSKLQAMQKLRSAEAAQKRLKSAELPHFDAKEYAPALKLRTKVARSSSREWKRLAKQYNLEHRKDGATDWQWSSGRQAMIPARRKALSEAQQLQALLRGEWPEQDYWIAILESQLDHEPIRQQAAAYFEHNYRNRDGVLFEGISLADMWNSRREFGISDVEAVAFLREILEDDSIESPIPGRLHDGIYAMIRDEYAAWREYAELRRALAVVFFDPESKDVPLILRSSAPRFDLAWAIVGDDPETMVKWLKQHKDRKSFLGSVEVSIAQQLEAGVSEEQLRARQGDYKTWLKKRTEEGLRREGLFGARGR